MRLKEIIRNPKEDIDWGKWQSGRMPRKEFPLSKLKSRKYRLGASYRWRICRFSQGGENFRVWVRFRPYLGQYSAVLGVEEDGDMVVLSRYEFHGTHPGWHVHAACKNVSNIVSGRLLSQIHLRIPKQGKFHRHDKFDVTEDSAADKAITKFRLYGPGTLL